jgi:hypothetical protein
MPDMVIGYTHAEVVEVAHDNGIAVGQAFEFIREGWTPDRETLCFTPTGPEEPNCGRVHAHGVHCYV